MSQHIDAVAKQSDINALNSNKATYGLIEGTTASTLETAVTDVPFPEGFTHQNCICVGISVQYSNGSWFSNYEGIDYFTNNHGATVTVHTNTGFTNRPFKVVLLKVQ